MYTGSIHRKQPRDQLQQEQVSIISVKELEVWASFSFYGNRIRGNQNYL